MSLTTTEKEKIGVKKIFTSWARPEYLGEGDRFLSVSEARTAIAEHDTKEEGRKFVKNKKE